MSSLSPHFRDDVSDVSSDDEINVHHDSESPTTRHSLVLEPRASGQDTAYTRISNASELSLPNLPNAGLGPPLSYEGVLVTRQDHIKSSIRRQKKERRILTSWWWWWELSAALLSVICMGLVVVVLSMMDGKPLSHWLLSISPNAVIAILTTVAKSALLLLVAECISQLKWLHFDQFRRLSDFQAFDDASRGPWGSFVFLWRIKGTAVMATVGCFVTLVSLGFEPTAQQVFKFPIKSIEAGNETGTIAVASHFNFDGSSNLTLMPAGARNPGISAPPLSLQLSIFTGLAGDVPDVQHSCTAPECHFGNVTTLGICGSCEDLTSTLKSNCTYQNGTTIEDQPNTPESWSCSFEDDSGNILPTMQFYEGPLSYTDTVMNVAASAGATYLSYEDVRASFTVLKRTNGFGYLALNDHNSSFVQASRCSWIWCERTYSDLSIINGAISTSATEEEALISVIPKMEYLAPMGSYKLTSNNTRANNYTIDMVSDASIFWHLPTLFNKELKRDYNNEKEEGPDPVLQLLYQQDVTNVTRNIALALSNKLREPGTNPNATTLKGTAMRRQTFVHVRWPWLILPMGLTVLEAVLLIVSIVMSERRLEPLLKSSALGMLFHSTEGFSQDDMKPPSFEDSNTLNDKATSMKVMLRWNADDVLKFEKADQSDS